MKQPLNGPCGENSCFQESRMNFESQPFDHMNISEPLKTPSWELSINRNESLCNAALTDQTELLNSSEPKNAQWIMPSDVGDGCEAARFETSTLCCFFGVMSALSWARLTPSAESAESQRGRRLLQLLPASQPSVSSVIQRFWHWTRSLKHLRALWDALTRITGQKL